MNRLRVCFRFPLAGLLLLSGCFSGPGDVPPLGNVTGMVTLDGQPLSNVRVLFQPNEGGRTSEAITGDNGQYRLIYSSTSYGAKVGSHRVHFEHPVDVENATNVRKVAIPVEFGAQSELSGDVKKGNNQLDFTLISPPPKKGKK